MEIKHIDVQLVKSIIKDGQDVISKEYQYPITKSDLIITKSGNPLEDEILKTTKYPSSLAQTVTKKIGGFEIGDSLANMTLAQILEKLLCHNESSLEPPSPVDTAPNFYGLINFKDINTIVFSDINEVAGSNKNQCTKPQTTYTHSGGNAFNKMSFIAIPKSWGTITGVVDGASISITGSYHWVEKALEVPGLGSVQYIIGGSKSSMAYNNGTTVKWNIT